MTTIVQYWKTQRKKQQHSTNKNQQCGKLNALKHNYNEEHSTVLQNIENILGPGLNLYEETNRSSTG